MLNIKYCVETKLWLYGANFNLFLRVTESLIRCRLLRCYQIVMSEPMFSVKTWMFKTGTCVPRQDVKKFTQFHCSAKLNENEANASYADKKELYFQLTKIYRNIFFVLTNGPAFSHTWKIENKKFATDVFWWIFFQSSRKSQLWRSFSKNLSQQLGKELLCKKSMFPTVKIPTSLRLRPWCFKLGVFSKTFGVRANEKL